MKRTPRHHSSQRGVALVITLFFIVLITIIAVGFFDSARADRSASGIHLERLRAAIMAREGIESTVATLRRETTDKVRNWTSSPGILIVPEDPTSTSSDQSRLKKEVWLHSGLSDPAKNDALDAVLRAPNLNVQTFDTTASTYLLTDRINATTNKVEEMKLLWVYVRRDGSYELPDPTKPVSSTNLPNQSPGLTDKTNPIIGRFAYWTDDESSKINYNLAWLRDPALNKNPPGHQTNVDLRALATFDDSTVNALHNFITANNYTTVNRFYNSPFDARKSGDAATRAALDDNKFNLTHFNSDPDTTYYGKQRMMLTTQVKDAVYRDKDGQPVKGSDGKLLTRPFLDVLKRTNPTDVTYLDPGTRAVIDGTKLTAIINDLVNNYLKRSDWPLVDGTGRSLQEKYYSAYTGAAREERLAQLALNIVDYVRSAESKLTIVEPIRAKWISGVFVDDYFDRTIAGQEDTFKGLPRGVYITEMGMWLSTTKNAAGKYRCLGITEIYLPKDYGIDSIDLTPLKTDGKSWTLYFNGTEPTIARRVNKEDATPTAFVWEAVGAGNEAKMTMKPGDYRTICVELPARDAPKAGETVPLRAAITLSGGGRIDVAPLGSASAGTKPIKFPLKATADEMAITSYESNDPRVNGIPGDWVQTQTNSFGKENPLRTNAVGKAPGNFVPEQDRDASGMVSAASMRMPYPSGHANNLNGRVRSPGELGLIHTGIEGSATAPAATGVPWRTLHLQPSKQGATVVPDWAFMDLFTVPADVSLTARALFAPHGNSTGGRVNMNAKPEPFPTLVRTDPLAAVLYGCRKSTLNNVRLTLAEAQTIARAIYDRKLASGATLPKGKLYPSSGPPNPVYESPGEVVEIQGVADNGEESEELVREIANLITTRGNVFSIYTVGQALKQTPSGKLVVTGEQRQQAMVERFLRDKGTATTADDEIGLRTVYFRNLTP